MSNNVEISYNNTNLDWMLYEIKQNPRYWEFLNSLQYHELDEQIKEILQYLKYVDSSCREDSIRFVADKATYLITYLLTKESLK